MLTIQTTETPADYDVIAAIAIGDEQNPLMGRGVLTMPEPLWHRVLDRFEQLEARMYVRLHRLCGPCGHEVHEGVGCLAAMADRGWDGPCGCRATCEYPTPAEQAQIDDAAVGERL